jgi:hypothetical protein
MLRTGEVCHAIQTLVSLLAITDPGNLADVELALAHQRLERDAALDGAIALPSLAPHCH